MDYNPLYQLIHLALANKTLIERHPDFSYSIENVINLLPVESTFIPIRKDGDKIIYDSKEEAGVGGMYTALQAQEGVQVIFSNDLGQSIHGIDALAIDSKRKEIIICEAKGTSRSKITVSQVLKRTKLRGRQMSWRWIWASLVDFAEHGPNANAFLMLYDDVINLHKLQRVVSISEVRKRAQEYTVSNTRLFYDDDFAHLKHMNEFPARASLKEWLDEIRAKNLNVEIPDLDVVRSITD